MKYTVDWLPSAEQELAALWNSAPDRSEISAAADNIDTALARDPLTLGESRGGRTRNAFLTMHTTTNQAGQSEVTILARILGNDEGKLPAQMARYVLNLGFSD